MSVMRAVALNVDATCPQSLQNREFVQFIQQATPRALVLLPKAITPFDQDGDYYISDAVAQHCSVQGMNFLMAVRGCSSSNTVYTPVKSVPWQNICQRPQPAVATLNATNATAAAATQPSAVPAKSTASSVRLSVMAVAGVVLMLLLIC